MNSTMIRTLMLGGFAAVLVSGTALAQNRGPTTATPAAPGQTRAAPAPAPTQHAPATAAPATAAPATAAGANKYTCMEFVTWRTSNNASMSPVLQSGLNPLEPPMTGTYASYAANPASAGGVTVSGATIETAATDCHGKTAATFNANPAYGESFCTSTSCPVCVSQNGQADSYGRVFQGAFREVYAIDRFLEIAETPQHYNKVAGYKVQCNAIVVTPENTLQGNIAPF